MMDTLFPEIVRIMTQLAPKMHWPVPLACDIEFGPNFNVAYNWNAIHSLDPKTGKAAAALPRNLWNRVEMQPGMWYIDDDGIEVVIPADETTSDILEIELETPNSPEESSISIIEGVVEGADIVEISQVEVLEPPKHMEKELTPSKSFNSPIREGRDKSRQVAGPVYTYQLAYCPGLIDGDDRPVMSIVRNAYQIADFFSAEKRGTHVLHLISWDRQSVIRPDTKMLIIPEEFELLARFLGLYGEKV
jgi:hypothetical protein